MDAEAPQLSDEEIAALLALDPESAEARQQIELEAAAYESSLKAWRSAPGPRAAMLEEKLQQHTENIEEDVDDGSTADDNDAGEDDGGAMSGSANAIDAARRSSAPVARPCEENKLPKANAAQKLEKPNSTLLAAKSEGARKTRKKKAQKANTSSSPRDVSRRPIGAVDAPVTSRRASAASTRSLTTTSRTALAPRTFKLPELVRHVLTPDERLGGGDAIAEALLHVKIVELQQVGLANSDVLEFVSNMTHLYAQHNYLKELQGLQLAVHLTVIVVHHNELTTLEDLADLPSVTLIDASYNKIAALDPEKHLPCATLKSLNLLENPCSPRYLAPLAVTELSQLQLREVAEDTEYQSVFRTALLSSCPQLQHLDGHRITSEMRRSLGFADDDDEPLLLQMTNRDNETYRIDRDIALQSGLEAEVADSAFNNEAADGEDGLQRDGYADEGAEPASTRVSVRTPPPTDGAAVSPTDEDDEDSAGGAAGSGLRRPPAAPSSAAKRQPVPLAAAKGRAGSSLTHMILNSYELAVGEHNTLIAEAVSHTAVAPPPHVAPTSGVFDPRYRETDEDNDDHEGSKSANRGDATLQKLQSVHDEQTRLRSELLLAQRHYSDEAQALLTGHWDLAQKGIRDRAVASQERRLAMRERLSKPSAAYLAALETLTKEATNGNLDQYRVESK